MHYHVIKLHVYMCTCTCIYTLHVHIYVHVSTAVYLIYFIKVKLMCQIFKIYFSMVLMNSLQFKEMIDVSLSHLLLCIVTLYSLRKSGLIVYIVHVDVCQENGHTNSLYPNNILNLQLRNKHSFQYKIQM